MSEDSIEVKVIKGDAGTGYLVPSAFSPNGDGNNDCLGIRNWGVVTDLRFTVYDRWGITVFSTTDPLNAGMVSTKEHCCRRLHLCISSRLIRCAAMLKEKEPYC